MRGEWIEIAKCSREYCIRESSLPMRGEWIEISRAHGQAPNPCVSPHAGRVD